MSSVGKGIAAASIGTVLKSKGFRVTALKADPYMNVDAGTMNPTEHGEVFVTADGDETDQDVGNYERFLDENIYKINYMTTGRIYQTVIGKERNLEYGGRCVEVVPDIPKEIIRRIHSALKETKSEIAIVEIGGTLGEYQNLLFLEAARMLKRQKPNDVIFFLVSYLPIPSKVGEMKTKPTQAASRELNACGIQADFILGRAERPLDNKRREKLADHCGVAAENVISAPDVDSIYEIPINFENENLGEKVLHRLHLKPRRKDLKNWRKMVEDSKGATKEVKIGIVGKYFETGDFELADAYLSVIEAIKHASWEEKVKVKLSWLSAGDYGTDPNKLRELEKFDGIIVPGGFGARGVEGKIAAAGYCRRHHIPYLGLCYGMQIATVEFARNVAGLADANTEEINPKTPHPVIHIMPEQKEKLRLKDYGGSMRLGGYDCRLVKGTIAYNCYANLSHPVSGTPPLVRERHRHRFELNNDYRDQLVEKGLVVSGLNPERDLVEIIEIKNHPFFVGVQFHPEFHSRPGRPHPLFVGLIKAAKKRGR